MPILSGITNFTPHSGWFVYDKNTGEKVSEGKAKVNVNALTPSHVGVHNFDVSLDHGGTGNIISNSDNRLVYVYATLIR